MEKRNEELRRRLLKFAARVAILVEALPDTRMGRHVAAQLVRCETSPLANFAEACAAESRADFIHKMKICLKELRETLSWIELIHEAKLVTAARISAILDECEQLGKIFASSVITATKNTKGGK